MSEEDENKIDVAEEQLHLLHQINHQLENISDTLRKIARISQRTHENTNSNQADFLTAMQHVSNQLEQLPDELVKRRLALANYWAQEKSEQFRKRRHKRF